jgi:hypothetical protein
VPGVTAYPTYRADGAWAALLDLTQRMVRFPADESPAVLLPSLAQLADRFELMGGIRERDLAELFRAFAALIELWPEEGEEEEKEPAASAAEAAPERDEAWDEDEPLVDET